MLPALVGAQPGEQGGPVGFGGDMHFGVEAFDAGAEAGQALGLRFAAGAGA
jgi:hypothetical protein